MPHYCGRHKSAAMRGNIQKIKGILKMLQKTLHKRFGKNFRCLLLYGSWAKGTARKDSDIDLLVIFRRVGEGARKQLHEVERDIPAERKVAIHPCSLKDFQKEKIPLYTAVKREGIVLYGEADLSINPAPPEVKYADFFEKSRDWESRKVKLAEELLKRKYTSGIAELCFIASKHCIQASLAMKGEGYSSKMAVILPFTEKIFGKEVAETFANLFTLYVKSEYCMEFLTEQEAKQGIQLARKVLRLYKLIKK